MVHNQPIYTTSEFAHYDTMRLISQLVVALALISSLAYASHTSELQPSYGRTLKAFTAYEHPTDGPFWVHTKGDLNGAETRARAMHAASITETRLRVGTNTKESVLQVHHKFSTSRLNALVVSGLTKEELQSIEGVSSVTPDM
jgi:hypothetical protein